MFILEDKCEAINGSRPSPEKVEVSPNGALLGFEVTLETEFGVGASTLGLYENSEDIICARGRAF